MGSLSSCCFSLLDAKTGKGDPNPNFVNIIDYLHVFKEMDYPVLINEEYFTRFSLLQNDHIVFLLLLLVTIVIWAPMYEIRMDHTIWIHKKDRNFTKSLHLILCSFFLHLSLLNDLFDLIFSGALTHPQYLTASIQSLYSYLPIKATIGESLVMLIISRLLGLGILYFLTVYICQRSRDLKSALMISCCSLLLFYFSNASLVVGTYLPVGYIDLFDSFLHSGYILAFDMSAAVFSVILSFLLFIFFLAHRVWRDRRVP